MRPIGGWEDLVWDIAAYGMMALSLLLFFLALLMFVGFATGALVTR